MKLRYASDRDVPLLAELNHQLIEDEHASNPMSVAELAARLCDWLNGEYRAVLFEVDSTRVGAVDTRNPRALETLLAAGADPRLPTRIDDCETPLELAERTNLPELAELLGAWEAPISTSQTPEDAST